MSMPSNPPSLRVGYEAARLELARLKLTGQNARKRAARNATTISAQALSVERVGIWLIDAEGRGLTCFDQYERSRGGHVLNGSLLATDYPGYVAALKERRAIAADDRHVVAQCLVPVAAG